MGQLTQYILLQMLLLNMFIILHTLFILYYYTIEITKTDRISWAERRALMPELMPAEGSAGGIRSYLDHLVKATEQTTVPFVLSGQ